MYADACLLFRIVRSVMAVVTNRVCTTVGCAQSCAHVRSLGIHSGQKGIENTRTQFKYKFSLLGIAALVGTNSLNFCPLPLAYVGLVYL